MLFFHLTDTDMGDEAVLNCFSPRCNVGSEFPDRPTGVYLTSEKHIPIWASVLGKISPDGFIYGVDVDPSDVVMVGDDSVSNRKYYQSRVSDIVVNQKDSDGFEVVISHPVKAIKLGTITGEYRFEYVPEEKMSRNVWHWIY